MNKIVKFTKNKGMESLFLLIPLFFVVVIIIPIKIKAKICYNAKNNRGVIKFSIFCFSKIFVFKFKKKAIIVKSKKKRKELNLNFSSEKMRFIEQFTVQIEHKLQIDKMCLFGQIGISTADKTALVVGICNVLSKSVLCVFKTKKHYAKNLYAQFMPVYNKNIFKVCGDINVSISLFDILYGLIMSSVIIKRSEKYERI